MAIRPLIAGDGGVVATFFEVLQEGKHDFGFQIASVQMVAESVFGAEVIDQELKGVAIAFDGVGAHAALVTQMRVKEVMKQGS
jgi:hypothetical protein